MAGTDALMILRHVTNDAMPLSCEASGETILFVALSKRPIAALDVKVDYSAVEGEFVGSDENVACTSRLPGALWAANDGDAVAGCERPSVDLIPPKTLSFGFVRLVPFDTPVTLAACRFVGDVAAAIIGFAIEVTESHDGSAPIVPPPRVIAVRE